ncbi:MAG TPA: hypothetical protein VGY77_02550 [Gemmataceae bacterium]|nr:hypothetical protein [Gemmataceae bacterium]
MKLDKETLIKEHFWFLLSLLVPLVLISMILLGSTSTTIIAGQEKNVKDAKTKLESIPKSGPKNSQWMEKLEVRDKLADEQKSKIWKKAWEDQVSFMTWPENLSRELLDSLNKMYFGAEIPERIRSKYGDKEIYSPQFYQAIEVVQPKDPFGRVVVQTANAWETLIRIPVINIRPPTSEDIWLAQEDAWVQRGMLQIVRNANDMVAAFKKKATNLKPEGSGLDRQIFTNSDWMLDLTLTRVENKTTLKCRLTNLGNRRESLGIYFQVGFKGSTQNVVLIPEGEPLPPGKSVAWDRPLRPLEEGNPTAIETVKQLYDWRTVPIKRVDKIEIGYFSNRHATKELLMAAFSKPKEGEQKDASASGAIKSSGDSPGLPMAPGGDREVTGSGKSHNEGTTVNGLRKNRYIEVSEQVRRMPIGLVFIVDQEHIQDVLTAVANSPLRIQTTEVHWRRFHGDIKPHEEDKPMAEKGPGSSEGRVVSGAAGGLLPAPPAGGSVRPGGLPVPAPPAGGSIRPGGLPYVPGREAGSASSYIPEDQEWDLVELAIYGIASIYERFPPPAPPAESPSSGTPAKTGQ